MVAHAFSSGAVLQYAYGGGYGCIPSADVVRMVLLTSELTYRLYIYKLLTIFMKAGPNFYHLNKILNSVSEPLNGDSENLKSKRLFVSLVSKTIQWKLA